MAYFLKKSNYKKGTYLQIYESFYDPERKASAHRSYKAIGYVHELQEQGIDDPISFDKEEVVKLNLLIFAFYFYIMEIHHNHIKGGLIMTFQRKPTLVRNIVFLLALMLTLTAGVPLQAGAYDNDVKPTKITAVGKKTITVAVGEEFDLKVKISPKEAEDDYLRWKIVSGSKYIRFNDEDRNDEEAEFKAKKTGTAKVRCYIQGTGKKVTFTVKVKAAANQIKADSSKKQIVELGDDFDLEIKKYAGLKNKYLKWTIKDETIVVFDSKKKTGDEVEFRAKKLGKTKITCKNTKTGQKITFQITVTAHDYD